MGSVKSHGHRRIHTVYIPPKHRATTGAPQMPITQTRMIDLINAGLDYQQALQFACKLIREARENIYAGADSIKEIDDLAILADESALLSNPTASGIVIQLERRHFKQNASRNITRRNLLRAARSTLNPRSTAPESLADLSSLKNTSRAQQMKKAMDENRAPQFRFRGISKSDQQGIEKEADNAMALQKKQEEFAEIREQFQQSLQKKKQSPNSARSAEEIEDELDSYTSGSLTSPTEDAPEE